ncbi:MAG: secretin N-terminal domain-containing protein [Opitutaceae bacterium]
MTYRIARLSLAAGCLAFALAASAQVGSRPTGAFGRPTRVGAESIIKPGRAAMMNSFTLQGGDIDSVLGALQANTGRIVIHPSTLPPGTYTIDVDHPIPMREFILALETQLFENGIAVIPLGKDFLKVVPLVQAKQEAPEFIEGSTLGLPPSSRIATKLFQFHFLRAADMFRRGPMGGFGDLLTNTLGGGVVVFDKENSALVTDTVSNLQRIEMLLKQVDRPALSGFTMKFYQLDNGAKASDVVTKMHALLQGAVAEQLGSGTTYNADDRTNQVIVITDKREVPFFNELISKLDLKSAPNTRTAVIYLQHADATTLQTVLASVISGQVAATQKATGSAPVATANPASRAGFHLSPAAAEAVKEASSAAFSPYASVVADERSNSIVVSGTSDDVRLVRDLVAKLDKALAQVRIQVIIAEVTLSDTDISGIQSLGLTVNTDNVRGTHITNFAGGSSGAAIPDTNITGWDLTDGVVNPLAFNAMFEPGAAGAKSRVHVLSAPTIVTAHAQKATITVGEQLPVINSIQTSAGTSEPYQNESVSYQNVAINLNVTPLIGDNGDIQLNLDQTVDTVIGEVSVNGNNQPEIGHREAKSYVTVKDNQMIVLGGMQETQMTQTQNKIGFLYEIPILSQILGGHTDDLERTELLFFIRPHIIRPDETTEDTQRRIQEMSNRDQINQFLRNPAPQPNNKVQNFLDRFKGDD